MAEDASGTEIGRHDYLIKRRQGVPVLDYMENAYAYYTANKVTRVSLVGEEAISFEKIGDPSVADHGLLWIDWPFLNHREYRLRGEYTYESAGELSHFGFGFDSPAGGHGESKAYFELNDDFYVRDQLHPTHYSFDEIWGKKYQWGRINAGGAYYIDSGTIRSSFSPIQPIEIAMAFFDLSADFTQDVDGDGIEDFVDPNPTTFDGDSFVIRLRGSATMKVPFGESFLDPGAVAYDPTDGDLTHQITESTFMDAAGNGFTVTYRVQNSAQASQEISRYVELSPAQALVIASPPDGVYSRWYRSVELQASALHAGVGNRLAILPG